MRRVQSGAVEGGTRIPCCLGTVCTVGKVSGYRPCPRLPDRMEREDGRRVLIDNNFKQGSTCRDRCPNRAYPAFTNDPAKLIMPTRVLLFGVRLRAPVTDLLRAGEFGDRYNHSRKIHSEKTPHRCTLYSGSTRDSRLRESDGGGGSVRSISIRNRYPRKKRLYVERDRAGRPPIRIPARSDG